VQVVSLDKQVTQETLVLVVLMDKQDQQDHQDHVEHQEVLVLQGTMEPQDQLVYQVMQVRWVILVTMGQ